MGILVDDGKVAWDEPVRTYLPDFKLQDEYASAHATPRDLLSHRTGLPRHDLMWIGGQFSRRELYDRLRYLEMNKELRTAWQYQNLMFMTAGIPRRQGRTARAGRTSPRRGSSIRSG